MIQEYSFFRENTLKFEDSKTVRELLEYAFEQYGYYEPFGMDTVSIYQANIPHFTLDTSRKCYEEIKDCRWSLFCLLYSRLLILCRRWMGTSYG